MYMFDKRQKTNEIVKLRNDGNAYLDLAGESLADFPCDFTDSNDVSSFSTSLANSLLSSAKALTLKTNGKYQLFLHVLPCTSQHFMSVILVVCLMTTLSSSGNYCPSCRPPLVKIRQDQ